MLARVEEFEDAKEEQTINERLIQVLAKEME